MSGDEISLTLPADEAFHRVAHLVLGGLAVRLDLTIDHLEDLGLAIDTLLEHAVEHEEVTVRVQVLDGGLRAIVGPFSRVGSVLDHGGAESLNLRRILRTVCESVEVADRDGAQWVELTKRMVA